MGQIDVQWRHGDFAAIDGPVVGIAAPADVSPLRCTDQVIAAPARIGHFDQVVAGAAAPLPNDLDSPHLARRKIGKVDVHEDVLRRTEEQTSELQSLMRHSYALY